MTKYIIPLILSICFSTPSYACGCLPLDDEPPTTYVSFTITSVKDKIYEAIGKRKEPITFTKSQIVDGNELYEGDIVLVEETNDTQRKMIGVELFIPHEQVETE
jgi:hypothetical protein